MCDNRRSGSILVLVVALLAVLFVTGIGFLAMTSVDNRSSLAGRKYATIVVEADAAIQAVVAEISRDNPARGPLAGLPDPEWWDYPWTNPSAFGVDDDAWLAPILPEGDGAINTRVWRHISNLTGKAGFGRPVGGRPASLTAEGGINVADCEADTTMDGVKDALWTLSPSGRFRIAYRVIDMSAMINLNVAGRGFIEDLGTTQFSIAVVASTATAGWDYYTLHRNDGDVYLFLFGVSGNYGRGADPSAERSGRHFSYDFAKELDNPFIRNRFPFATPFRTHDTLALLTYGARNGPVVPRFAVPLMTSRASDAGATATFAANRSDMPAMGRDSRDALTSTDSQNLFYTCTSWSRRMRPTVPAANLPACPHPRGWEGLVNDYDPTGRGMVNVNGSAAHGRNNPKDPVYTRALVAAIVLSGAMSDMGDGVMPLSQHQVEQLVLNIVDFRDVDYVPSTNNPNVSGGVDTVFNSGGLYGIEPQVFFTEVGVALTDIPAKRGNNAHAVELFNPYSTSIDLGGWQVQTPGGTVTIPANSIIAPGGRYVIRNQDRFPSTSTGDTTGSGSGVWVNGANLTDPALIFGIDPAADGAPQAGHIYLLRPAGDGTMLAVDMIRFDQTNTGGIKRGRPTWLGSATRGRTYMRRGDREWMQARDDRWKNYALPMFGQANGILEAGSVGTITYPRDSFLDRFYAGGGTPISNSVRDGRQLAIVASGLPAVGWLGGTYYGLRQLVGAEGKYWMCMLPHMSSTFAADRDAGLWREYTAHRFDTLGQLHWMMLVGPTPHTALMPGDPVTAKLSRRWGVAQPTGEGWLIDGPVRDLCLDFTRQDRADSRLFAGLTRLERHDDGVDDNGSGTPDDIGEFRQAGLINPNTATPFVMNYLSWLMHRHLNDQGDAQVRMITSTSNVNPKPTDPGYYTFARDIRAARDTDLSRGYRGFRNVGDVIKSTAKLSDTGPLFDSVRFTGGNYPLSLRNLRPELRYFYNGRLNHDGDLYVRDYFPVHSSTFQPVFPPSGALSNEYRSDSPYFHHQATANVAGDHYERHAIISRISDLMTVRSDTFLAYILLEEIDGATEDNYWTDSVRVVQRRRVVALIDRSLANRPWGHPEYRSAEVIARSIATW